MAYDVNKSNGTSIIVNDGQINTTDTNLSLVGRNASNYGEPIAENFVKLLENFAATVPPETNQYLSGNPLVGQLWFDTSVTPGVLKFRGTDGTWIATAINDPSNPVDFTVSGLTAIDDTLGTVFSMLADDIGGNVGVKGARFNVPVEINGELYVNTTEIDGDLSVTGISNFGEVNADRINVRAGSLLIEPAGPVTITDLSVTGTSTFDGVVTFTNPPVFPAGTTTFDDAEINQLALSQLHAVTNPGTGPATIYGDWNLAAGATLEATYADIAERFKSDAEYPVGTILDIGGIEEVTATAAEYSEDVFGVIADNPAFTLNSSIGKDHPAVTLVGRTPVRVIGKVKKGDRLVSSATPGVACAGDKSKLNMFNYIGRALEDKNTGGEALVMVAFGAK